MDDYKEVRVSKKVWILVPPGLTPEQEERFIAARKAAFDPQAAERDFLQAMADLKTSKLIDIQTVSDELRDQWGENRDTEC